MATLHNQIAVTALMEKKYEEEGWSTTTIRTDRYPGAVNWLYEEGVAGKFDYQGYMSDHVKFWISDPQVAFEFRLRFG